MKPTAINTPLNCSKPLAKANRPDAPPRPMMSAGSQQQLVAMMNAMTLPAIDCL